jgi:hypothetical protein
MPLGWSVLASGQLPILARRWASGKLNTFVLQLLVDASGGEPRGIVRSAVHREPGTKLQCEDARQLSSTIRVIRPSRT